ncbi:MAG: hypothetical protein GWN18_08000, partial [Thermoplasmata archaeon]|nr:hypothetical protein [Thermoplasmata archaeon]NIS11992.1 hypothetical protein [Thermoplasmata archaeon]NIS19907.1 hypothetical protein [Thermoplasmata archaeon]NIT77104.1 hypothetical protein [Thermoplasmata archaeon]NIU49016.1 hypothetical protein [Thermoplasmata archaeon]
MVHQDEYGVTSNEIYTVDARVYYVQFTAVDSRDIGLEWAQIGVTNSTSGRTMGSLTADPDGWAEFRLPIGVYDVEVLWQHAMVHTGTWTVLDDADWTIDAWVYYVNFHITDGGDMEGVKVDLAGAAVAVANETASTSLGPITTDAYGNAEFRLPLGDVSLEVVWKSTVVYTQEVLPVVADSTEEVTAWVYYINVKIKDSTGARLKGANVHIAQNGVAAESQSTPKNGIVIFRLPYGTYWVNMSYTTTYYLTPIDVSKSEYVDLMNSSLEVKFDLSKDDYPIPFYKTNLFWIILVIVLLILGIVFLIYRMRKADQEPTDAPPEEGEEGLEDLLDDLENGGSGGSIAAGAAGGAAVAEYSDDDLEEVSIDEDDDEPEEYSDEDLEEAAEEKPEEEPEEAAEDEEGSEEEPEEESEEGSEDDEEGSEDDEEGSEEEDRTGY